MYYVTKSGLHKEIIRITPNATPSVQKPTKRSNTIRIERDSGGEGGIRTDGTLAGSTVFETAPFDHSGTSPRFLGGGGDLDGRGLKRKGLRAKKPENFPGEVGHVRRL